MIVYLNRQCTDDIRDFSPGQVLVRPKESCFVCKLDPFRQKKHKAKLCYASPVEDHGYYIKQIIIV